jgi:hypothetical protein
MLVDTELHTLIKQAIANGECNPWVYSKRADFYFRYTQRGIGNGVLYPSFDVSNITIHKGFKSQGLFKSLMLFIEDEFKDRLIFIENLLEPRLIGFFEKRSGYTRIPKGDYDPAPSFYRLPL